MRFKHKDLYNWHLWFAWHPIRISSYSRVNGMLKEDKTTFWLEKVQRKKELFSGIPGYWYYKPLGE